ncbi:hypothetical protein [Flavobacterium sp.]|uniref:hypothetical protein n=1 Tax=Flavobacterium sp. TaxID=239 RepID=UPI002619328E|nr:hypothetical protein [Flavobacterium sp.]
MKKFLRLLTAAMATCVLLIFTNCQNDDNDITTSGSTQSGAINVKTISFEEFKKNSKAYAELNRAADRSSMSSKAIVNDTINGFFYDDRQVKVIEYDKYKTYTFQIYRDGVVSERFENLVILEDDAQNTSSYIFDYRLDYIDVKDLNNDVSIDNLENKYIVKSSNGRGQHVIHRDENGNCFYRTFYHPITEQYSGGEFYYEVYIECPTSLSVTENGNGGSVGGGGPNIIIMVPDFDAPGPVPNPGGPGGGGGGNDPEFAPPCCNITSYRFNL